MWSPGNQCSSKCFCSVLCLNRSCNTDMLIVQAITGDSVLMKFDKAKCALVDSLRRVEDIVPQSIGVQVSNSSFNSWWWPL